MNAHFFPPIRDPNDLPRRVLVLAAHPDDEVIGIGGLLDFHGKRGDSVLVMHATNGSAGDPDAKHEDIQDLRRREVTSALHVLGIPPPRTLGFEDGKLSAVHEELVPALESLFEKEAPELLYTFHGGEYHADHRSLASAACEARESLPAECRVLLFGVNQVVPFGALYEYSSRVKQKQKALACFQSQLAYLDFASKVMHRDQAATVNVELPEITHAELILESSLQAWPRHLAHASAVAQDALGPLEGGPGGTERKDSDDDS